VGRLRAEARRLLLDLVFPPRCAGCGRTGAAWCAGCDRRLHRLPPRTCSRCGRPFPPGGACPECSRHAQGIPVSAFGAYAPPLDKALTHLKYRPDRDLAGRFAGWLTQAYRQAGWSASCVVPVPLGRRREKQRGYNQVTLIAEALGAQLEMPVLPRALFRIRETDSQVGLDPAQRQKNVAGAFSADPAQVRGHTPLLVDDVFTTGATLAACARALRQAGALQVFGLTVARA
jgi:competence protein ComFC